jgi:DNA-binding PadR family transcriptional regulator
MKADVKRDLLRKSVLELLAKSDLHYTDLEKKICIMCCQFATSNTFKTQLRYLLENNYIDRISRGIYHITNKGKNYLNLLEN